MAKARQAASGAIDPATGAIRLDGGETIAAAMPLKAFLASPLGPRARPVMANDYIVYHALEKARIGGQDFAVGLIFDAKSEQLKLLTLWLIDDGLDEMARDNVHKRWLTQELPGIPARADGARRFPWGTIDAHFVPQNAESLIHVEYGRGLRDVIDPGHA